jgi:hypothetical protein
MSAGTNADAAWAAADDPGAELAALPVPLPLVPAPSLVPAPALEPAAPLLVPAPVVPVTPADDVALPGALGDDDTELDPVGAAEFDEHPAITASAMADRTAIDAVRSLGCEVLDIARYSLQELTVGLTPGSSVRTRARP